MIVIAIAAFLVAVGLARHVIIRTVIETAISGATGYQVRFANQRIGWSHAAFLGVHVVKNNDPILDAQRVDVTYALRDIFPGGQHRYGFASIAIQKPVLTITRHADGSITFTRPGGTSAAPPKATKQAAAPLFFTARIRNGVLRMIDTAPVQPDLAYQTVDNVSVDASVKSDARTTVRFDGVLVGRHASGAPVRRYPLSIHSVIDAQRGIALTRLRARQLPLRGTLGFFVHSPSVRFDDGFVNGVVASYYGLAQRGSGDFAYRAGGTFDLEGGRIAVNALAKPIRDLGGTFILTDSALATNALGGSLAGIPLRGRGALYDIFGNAQFRLALAADANIAKLRTLFTFAARQPITGSAHLETLLAAPLANPLIRTFIRSPRLSYDRYPIDGLNGVADYYDNALSIGGFNAHYGRAAMQVGGYIDFTQRGNDMHFILNARGSGHQLPYTDAIAPDSTIVATGLFEEPPGAGFNARGTIQANGPTLGTGTFAVDQYGVGEFGPFSFARPGGQSLAGAFELNRPISGSAGWLHIRNYRIADVRIPATLPGARVPSFPPIAGFLDGDVAVGGTPSTFGVAGTLHGTDMRVAELPIGSGTVTLAGTFTDLRLNGIAVDGPLGRFRGDGAYGNNVFGLRGNYDGSLAVLRRFIGDQTVTGAVHGPLRAMIAGNQVVIQTPGVEMAGASVRSVAIDSVAGTVAINGSNVRIVAADGTIGDSRSRVIAADVGGPFLVSAPNVQFDALRHTGIPLQGGTISTLGVADLRGKSPRYDGLLTLNEGIAGGYPVSGGADISFADSTATVRDGVAALGRTYGDFAGAVGGIGSTLDYDLSASVPIGDVDQVWKAMHVPLRTLFGSFAANLQIRGSGSNPNIAGKVSVPEGSYNGLDFRDARANVAIASGRLAARNGEVTVGSTHAGVDAAVSIARSAFDVNVHSADANLADFNDYFDEAETLSGRGPVAIAFANDGTTTRSAGRFDVSDFRYRRFAFGRTDATWWQPHGGPVSAAVNVRGEHGTLHANGSIAPAPGDPLSAIQHAYYRATGQASQVDIATWLPPFGVTAPVLGQVDMRTSVVGRWPRMVVASDATLHHGSVFGYTVRQGTLHGRSDGTRVTFTDSVLDLDFAKFTLNGSLGIDRNAPLALSLHTETPNLQRALTSLFPKGPRYNVAGELQADARIKGTFAKPVATVGFDLTQGHYASLSVPRVLGSVTYDGKSLVVNDAEATFSKGTILVAGSLPMRLQPLGVAPTAPLSFTVGASGLDLAAFSPFVPGPKTKLGGTLDGRLGIEGTLKAPRVSGTLTLANGSYVSDLDRAPVTGGNARLAFQGTSVALEALHANVGGGTIDGSGRLDLPFAGVPSSGYQISLAVHRARIDSPQYGRGTIDGAVAISRRGSVPVISGDLALSNASIPFNSIYRAASSGGSATSGPPVNIGFDLTANVERNVRVQSPIIDVGATGTVTLTGTLESPRLGGVLRATPGGVFSTYNRAFRIQQAVVRFDPSQGVVPSIDARAYAHVTNPDPDPTRNALGSADITITVQGPADELAQGRGIQFTSNPPYSREQIVGLLIDASIFGAVNFSQQGNGTFLRGAPGESNALLPPGVSPYQGAAINFNQEAFSILNGQLTQRFLAPIERVFIGALDLTDLELTVDYGGGVGYNLLKQIGRRDVYASFGQVLSYPVRTNIGFTSRPDATTSISFSYFTRNGDPALVTSNSAAYNYVTRVRGIQPLTGRQGFTFLVVRKYP